MISLKESSNDDNKINKLKPAKALQDALASMLSGNREFYLIDEQKVAYETVRKLLEKSLREANKVTSQS